MTITQFLNSRVFRNVFRNATDFATIEQRIAALEEEWMRGATFEQFVAGYVHTLQTPQEWWPVGQVPASARRALNLPKGGRSIDGAVRDINGDLFAYQVKFRIGRPPVGFREVATFLGGTERCTDRVLITNSVACDSDVLNRDGLRVIRGSDFDALTPAQMQQIVGWIFKSPVTAQPQSPLEWQPPAAEAVCKELSQADRTTLVMACGTGKTFTGMLAAQHMQANTVLVLVPSLALVAQALQDWVSAQLFPPFPYLCVCSDDSVADKVYVDPIVLKTTDVSFRTTTDSAHVRQWFTRTASAPLRVVFSTYQSAAVVRAGMPARTRFDLAIYDEAHKTVGHAGKTFAKTLQNACVPASKRLFMTATPRVIRRAATTTEGFLFASMDDEATYGRVAHTITFAEGVSLKAIVDYKIIVATVNEREVRTLKGTTLVDGDEQSVEWVAKHLAVAKAIKKFRLKKGLLYYSRVTHAKAAASHPERGIGRHLPNGFHVDHVNGYEFSVAERNQVLAAFAQPQSRLLVTNARCLTEGVDLPAVDFVAFMDPKKSHVDIVQAIGRAMRLSRCGTKTTGYVIVPVMIPSHTAGSVAAVERACAKTDWADVMMVCAALADHDYRFNEVITAANVAKLDGKVFNPRPLRQFVEVVGDVADLKFLRKAIDAVVVERGRHDSSTKKALLLERARRGEPKPRWGTVEYQWWCEYSRHGRVRSFDPEFTREIEALGWTFRTSQTQKDTFIAQARAGLPAPTYRNNRAEYHRLLSYIRPTHGSYDPLFAKKVEALGWRISNDRAVLSKAAFLERARRGEPKPRTGDPDYSRFLSYTTPSSRCYDRAFTQDIESSGWAKRDQSAEAEEKKVVLLQMARRGEPVPRLGTKERGWLNSYLKSGLARHKAFAAEIRSLGWALRDQSAEADEKKADFLARARRGDPKPPKKSREYSRLSNYTRPSSECYDADFASALADTSWASRDTSADKLARKQAFIEAAKAGHARPRFGADADYALLHRYYKTDPTFARAMDLVGWGFRSMKTPQ